MGFARRRTKKERNEEYAQLASVIVSIAEKIRGLGPEISQIMINNIPEGPIQDDQYSHEEMESMMGHTSFDRNSLKPAVIEVLTAVDEGILSGIHGIAVELCNLNSNPHKIALIPLLRNDIGTIIVEDEAAAFAAIEFLQEFKFGQAKFMPITVKELRPTTAVRQLLGQPGVIDLAVNVLACEEKYRPVFSVICRNAVIVEDINSARIYMDRHVFMITNNGDRIYPNGVIKGGSSSYIS